MQFQWVNSSWETQRHPIHPGPGQWPHEPAPRKRLEGTCAWSSWTLRWRCVPSGTGHWCIWSQGMPDRETTFRIKLVVYFFWTTKPVCWHTNQIWPPTHAAWPNRFGTGAPFAGKSFEVAGLRAFYSESPTQKNMLGKSRLGNQKTYTAKELLCFHCGLLLNLMGPKIHRIKRCQTCFSLGMFLWGVVGMVITSSWCQWSLQS